MEERRAMTRKWLFLAILVGWSFFWSPCLVLAGQSYTIEGPYKPLDGLEAFKERTGLPVYHPENSFDLGWCTWFAAAVFPEPVPMKPGSGENDAAKWMRNFKDAGYETAQIPEVGCIVVWGSSIGRGHGHVAIVTKVHSQDKFEVWDSNWSQAFDRQVRRRMVFKSSESAIIGFIPPRSGRSPIPISPDLKTGAVCLAIVFDCSNSMVDPPDKMERAKQATYSVIDAARRYDQISLVSFAYRGWLLAPPTSPGDPGARNGLQAKTAQIAPDDWTNIGAGLELAYGQLAKVPEGRFRSILLLTDGGNNQGSFWSVVNKCQQARIPIYTVAYGADADRPTLSEIAKRTGGVAYLAGQTNLTQVYQRISAMSRKASVLTSYQDRINQGDRHIYPVLIPDDIRRAWFGTDWEGSRVEISLISPSGKEITSRTSDPRVRYAQGDTYCLYEIAEPENGQWQVKLHGAQVPRTEQVNVTVSGESPLWANSLLSTPYWCQGSRVPLRAHLEEVDGSSLRSISHARVEATIRKPKIPPQRLVGVDSRGRIRINVDAVAAAILDRPETITLRDDGGSCDAVARDGIFTGIYAETDREGPCEVEIRCRARLSDGRAIDRILRESFHVGDPRTTKVSLLELIDLIR
jgi:surface antigen